MSNDIKYRADTNGFEMGGPMSQTDTSYPNGVATQREYPGSWEIAAFITKGNRLDIGTIAVANRQCGCCGPEWECDPKIDLEDVHKLVDVLTVLRDEMDARHRKQNHAQDLGGSIYADGGQPTGLRG